MDCIVHGQNSGVGGPSLLQVTFPTQGSNSGLLHCRWILYQLSYEGNRPQNWPFSVPTPPGSIDDQNSCLWETLKFSTLYRTAFIFTDPFKWKGTFSQASTMTVSGTFVPKFHDDLVFFHVFSLLPHLAYAIPFKQHTDHYSFAQSISPKPDMTEDRGLKSYIF